MLNDLYKVAVYGTLRKGNGNNVLLSNSKMVGTVFTAPNYQMFSLGGFPGIRSGNKRVLVEVYEVDDATLSRLDRLEGYRGEGESNFYERELTETALGTTYIYTLDDDRYEKCPTIESGNWNEHKEVRLKDLI